MTEEIHFVSEQPVDLPFYIKIAGLSYCDGTYHILRPRSPQCTVEYILDGTGTVRHGGKLYHPEKGDVYLLGCEEDHDYESDEEHPWKKIWFNASGPLVNTLIEQYGLRDRVVIDGTGTLPFFEKIVNLCREGKTESEINTRAAVICHELFQVLNRNVRTTPRSENGDAILLKNYLDVHASEAVSAETLAALIFKSKSQTLRLFKKAYALTPYEYLIEVRLNRAKVLLRDSGLSVKEIAYRVGFNDEHYFSFFFKQKCGLTPSAYRKGEK